MESDYESLLKRAYSKMPSKKTSGERFEIPKSKLRTEGNKTIITNFSKIAECLDRDKKELSRYLFKELGSVGSVTHTELVIQGKFNAQLVDKKIENYCKKYVLCPHCNRPDTHITYTSGKMIIECEACGGTHPVT